MGLSSAQAIYGMTGTGIMERQDNAGSVTLGVTQTSVQLPGADIFHTMRFRLGTDGDQAFIDLISGAASGTVGSSAVPSTLTTALSGSNNDITFTAVTPGADGDLISIEYAIAPGSGISNPLVITVTGKAILVYLATDASAVATTNAAQLVDAIAANTAAAVLVTAEVAGGSSPGNGALVNMSETFLADGVDSTGFEIDDGDGMGRDHQGKVQPYAEKIMGIMIRMPYGKANFSIGSLGFVGPIFEWTDPAGNPDFLTDLNVTADGGAVSVIIDIVASSQP